MRKEGSRGSSENILDGNILDGNVYDANPVIMSDQDNKISNAKVCSVSFWLLSDEYVVE